MASVGGSRGTFLPPDPRVDEPFRLTPQAALRVAILGGIALVVFGALFLRLWALEVLSGQQYLRVAQNNQLRTVRLEAPRGAIRDRNGKLLVGNRPSTAVQLWPSDLPDKWYPRFRELSLLSRALGVPVKEMRTEIARRKADPLTPVTIKESARRDEVNYLLEHRDRFPGLRIADSYVRMYPQGSVAAQLFGYVTEVSPQQLKRKPVGIKAGDKVGQTGIESAFDGYLRGEAGAQQLRVDALGTPRGQPTPSRVPRPGNDVLLTIDLRLQKAAQRALAYGIQRARDSNCYGCWDANGGAIVALDPHDGSVLALASSPTYQPSVYAGHVTTKALAEQGLTPATAREKNFPSLNRALVAGYPPGSTFKPVTAIAALQEHLVSPSTLLPCTGSYTSPADRGTRSSPTGTRTSTRHGSADGARVIVRHVLLPTRQRLLRLAARARPPASGVGQQARLRTSDRHRRGARVRRPAARRPSGGSGTSRRRSTSCGSPATRSSSRSGRRTCS